MQDQVYVLEKYDLLMDYIRPLLEPNPVAIKVYGVDDIPAYADELVTPCLLPLITFDTLVDMRVVTARHGRWDTELQFDVTCLFTPLVFENVAAVWRGVQQAMNLYANAVQSVADSIAVKEGLKLNVQSLRLRGPSPVPFFDKASYWGFTSIMHGM